MKTWIWYIVALAAVFFGGWLLGRHYAKPEIVETTRIDTLFYEKPTPISTSDITVSVNVPKVLFASQKPEPSTVTNKDTIQVSNYVSDSVRMSVTLRTLEYRDSTYYARVSGPVVGTLGPSLDYFETYSTTTTRTQIIRPKTTFTLAAIIGTDYAKSGWTPYAELGFSFDLRFATLTATAGLDNVFKSPQPRIGAEIGIPVWRK